MSIHEMAIEAMIDEALRESFPASDPPPWTPVRAGSPGPSGSPAKQVPDAVHVVSGTPATGVRPTSPASRSRAPPSQALAAATVAAALVGGGALLLALSVVSAARRLA